MTCHQCRKDLPEWSGNDADPYPWCMVDDHLYCWDCMYEDL